MKRLNLISALLMIPVLSVSAHGLHVTVENTVSAVVIQAGYSEYEPAAGITVTISNPESSNNHHQTGTTDRNGIFLFLPDRAGLWKAVLDDTMGHRKEVEVTVTQEWIDTRYSENDEIKTGIPLYYKIIVGISIFWGFTGLLYWRKTKQSLQSD